MPNLTVFTQYTENDIFLNAAALNGWDVQLITPDPESIAQLRKGDRVYRVHCPASRISVNTSVSTAISSNKFLTNQILSGVTPYVADTRLFDTDALTQQQIEELLQKHSVLVAKPTNENNGIGVSTNLRSVAEVQKAVDQIKKLGSKKLIIENHVTAHKEYRVIVWKGKIVDVIERIPAYVLGDGHSTVAALIEAKNAFRVEKFAQMSFPILVDVDLQRNLADQQKSVDYVPADGERVVLRNMCNMMQGGETSRIDLSVVHPAYVELFMLIYQRTWLNYYGADLMTIDIAQPPEVGVTIINELNASPGFPANYFADLAEDRPFYGATQLLKMMEQDPPSLIPAPAVQ